MKVLCFVFFSLIVTSFTAAQNSYPESDPISTYPTGLYYQHGPGASNTVGWTYPYGTKLTVHHSISRNFEIGTEDKDARLVFRQWSQNLNDWTPWRTIMDLTNPIPDFIMKNGTAKTLHLRIDGNGNAYVNNMNDFVGNGSSANGMLTFTGQSMLRFNTGNVNSSGTERMRIESNGNVLIGKTSQSNTSYKLDVAGKVRADEIVVNTTGADYVFEEDYKLKSLDEVETFINQNKHLSGIPSAAEMQAQGMSVGELNTKLLEKIEELTLHTINQQKEIEQLKAEKASLQEGLEGKMQEMEKTIDSLVKAKSNE